MGFRHWIDDTIEDVREDPSLSTVEISLRKFWAGVLGRTRESPATETVIWEDDWDVLVILDGCRLDLLRETARTNPFEWFPPAEDIEAIWSVGSTSKEWLENTFTDEYSREIEATACVTGNPYMSTVEEAPFAELVQVSMVETEHGIMTVPPRRVTDPGIDLWRRRKELEIDRLVLHYMQPHAPFRARPEWFREFKGQEKFGSQVWWRLCDGTVEFDDFWAAYSDNLQWVLEDLDLIHRSIDGTVRITADHGNAAGDHGIYGHPEGVPVPAVRQVPWSAFEANDTGDYDPTHTASKVATVQSQRDVDSQLSALGYT